MGKKMAFLQKIPKNVTFHRHQATPSVFCCNHNNCVYDYCIYNNCVYDYCFYDYCFYDYCIYNNCFLA